MEDADYLEACVTEHASLEMLSSRMWTNACFRYRSDTAYLDLDQVNTEIRNRLIAEGSFMVSRSNAGGNIVLRMVMRIKTSREHRLTVSSPEWSITATKYAVACLLQLDGAQNPTLWSESTSPIHEPPTSCSNRPV